MHGMRETLQRVAGLTVKRLGLPASDRFILSAQRFLTPISPFRSAGAGEGQGPGLNPKSIAPGSGYVAHEPTTKTFGVKVPAATHPTNVRGEAHSSNRTSFFGE